MSDGSEEVLPAFPTFAVTDLGASTTWYREALGFELVGQIPGSPGSEPHGVASHLRWTRGADLFLIADDPESPAALPDERRGLGVTLTFGMVEGSVDELAARAQAHGAEVLLPPVDRPWNVREVLILDPDGYRLLFTQRLDPERNLAAIAAEIPTERGAAAKKQPARRRRRVAVA
jgi:catechol 2,3-dioxygenase-like lactoylglutathione lyase family enzyme